MSEDLEDCRAPCTGPIAWENIPDEVRDIIFKYLPEIGKAKELQLIIGPEGGLSNKEIEAAQKAKVSVFTMGPRILRTETAAISALSIMMLGE